MMKTIKHNISTWKKVILIPIIALFFLAIACQDQVIEGIREVADNSSVIVTEYPAEVKKALHDLKLKNPNATFQVFGVQREGEIVFEKDVENESIKTYSVPNPNKGELFTSFLILEKDKTLDQIAEISATQDKVYTVVEQAPEFEGGMPALHELISTNLQYPKVARDAGIQGTAFVEFIVNTDGSVSDVNVLKGVSPECDAEAIRVVGLSKWKPGKQNGAVVKVRFVLPIKFVLDDVK